MTKHNYNIHGYVCEKNHFFHQTFGHRVYDDYQWMVCCLDIGRHVNYLAFSDKGGLVIGINALFVKMLDF
jgi:hypothetical protein